MMPKKNARIRIFSIRRILIACVLGFLVPLSYAITLSLVSDYTGKPMGNFMVYPFGWPRPLWIFLIGHQPSDDDIILGIVFLAFCNIALYGTLIYVVLSALQFLKYKPAVLGLPPSPDIDPRFEDANV
jgi:hypothetical protein